MRGTLSGHQSVKARGAPVTAVVCFEGSTSCPSDICLCKLTLGARGSLLDSRSDKINRLNRREKRKRGWASRLRTIFIRLCPAKHFVDKNETFHFE